MKPKTPYYIEKRNKFVDSYGQSIIYVHTRRECIGEHCVIHNPSRHHMRTWPLKWRWDKSMFERICPHGTGHPDPDDPGADSVHGCDGCCNTDPT